MEISDIKKGICNVTNSKIGLKNITYFFKHNEYIKTLWELKVLVGLDLSEHKGGRKCDDY